MKRYLLPAVLAATLILGACAEDSSLPTPSGQGRVRAINAIPTSPSISFLIEERLTGSMDFRSSTSPNLWDDLEYTFNFEVTLASGQAPTRVASQFIDVVADRDYTLVVSGALASPDVTVWESGVREWSGNETVFEMRFGHMSPALGDVDLYFAPPGTAPMVGMEIATLSFGDVTPVVDYEAVEMVVTITAPGDPATVLFESDALTLTATNSYVMSTFDTTPNDLSGVAVTLFNLGASSGGAIADVRVDSAGRFFHASRDFGDADIYVDDPPMTPLVQNHMFRDVTGDLSIPAGDLPVTYTAAGNIGSILIDEDRVIPLGTRINFYVVRNLDDEDVLSIGAINRRPIETQSILYLTNTAADNNAVDVYVIPPGESVDDNFPIFTGLPTLFPLARVPLIPDTYDLYLTVPTEKTVLFGPLNFDALDAGITEIVIYDTVDPAVPEAVIIPPP